MEKRTNAGYNIIKSISLPEEEFVLGIKTVNGANTYVTWCCVNKVNYCYGHYITNKIQAEIDLYQRAKKELNWLIKELKRYKEEQK